MPLLNFESLDLVPEELRSYAKPLKDGESKVSVNVVPSVKIDEFRDNNIALAKERDNLREALEPLRAIVGEDTDGFQAQLQELRLTAQRVKDGELKEGRQFEESLGKRTEELRKDYDTRLQAESKEKVAWKSKFADLETQYKQTKIAHAIKDACMDADSGVDPRAVPDLLNAAMSVFRFEGDGKIVPYEGSLVVYGNDGTTAMTPREWVKRLKEEKPFFFKTSYGGGGGGDGVDVTIAGQQYKGMTKEAIKKMSPGEKLALANGERPKLKATA